MSEWPKRHWDRNGKDEIVHTEVIPAELGREMARTLRYVATAASVDPENARLLAEKALTHYEQKVAE